MINFEHFLILCPKLNFLWNWNIFGNVPGFALWKKELLFPGHVLKR